MNLDALKIPITQGKKSPCKVRVFADSLPAEYRQILVETVDNRGMTPTALATWISKTNHPAAPGRHSLSKHLDGGCDCES